MKKIAILLFITFNGLGLCSSFLGYNNFESVFAQWTASEQNIQYANGYVYWQDANGIRHSQLLEQGEWDENNAQASFYNNDANGYDLFDTEYDVNDDNFLELWYDDDMHLYYYDQQDDMWHQYYQGVDCNSDGNGSAYIDNCGTCVGGTTNLAPCAASTGTTEPIPKDCDSVTNAKGAYITRVLDSVNNKPLNTRVRDSAYIGKHEAGVSIIENSPGVFTEGHFKSGTGATIGQVFHSTINNIIAVHHAHPINGYGPISPGDWYNITTEFIKYSSLIASYVTAGSDSTQYAYTFNGDTTELRNFTNTFPRDSIFVTNMPDWAKDTLSIPPFNNKKSADRIYELFYNKFLEEKYTEDMAYLFANIVIEKYYLNVPNVKIYMRKNGGQFRALDIDVITIGGFPPFIIPTICN